MVLLKKQLSILSGILSGCREQVTKCQFLIKATLSEATSPFNAQLNGGNPSGNQHITAYYVNRHARVSQHGGDSAGAADSAKDRSTQKSALIFSCDHRALQIIPSIIQCV